VELFNFADSKLGETLRARGITVWGCPMNGSARYEPLPHFTDRLANILSWWRHGQRLGIEGLLVTSWEPYRLAMEMTTVVDAAAATLWLNPGVEDPREMLTRGFQRVFGQRSTAKSAKLALASDRYPFGGYPRWEINNRWDTVSRRESLAQFVAEEKFTGRIAREAHASALPLPLRASLDFRHYLAQRDVFVRRAAHGLAKPSEGKAFAKALAAGRRAARLMWTFTRDRRRQGANDRILANDARRLREWQRGRNVFGGPWQLAYVVENIRPCLQLVSVEQQEPDGTWVERQSCFTIEFQTRAAQPRTDICREHAAPVEWDGDPARFPKLRVALRGSGVVRIADVELTDGKKRWRSSSSGRVLGRPAQTRGLPPLEWRQNLATLPVRFAG
jgi:hypothetical protein